jgi:hypothetical protein
MILGAYFIQTYLYHDDFKEDLKVIKYAIPEIFNRYRTLMLSYALLKERIISNNSLSYFESISFYGQQIDSYYHDQAIENERRL